MEKNVVAVFPTNEIKTGAHRRYVELINGLAKRGYRVVCFAERNVFDSDNCSFIELNLDDQKRLPITIQLAKEVLFKSKSIDFPKTNQTTVITFGETTALAAIVLKLKLKTKILLGIRTNIHEDRKLSIYSQGIRLGNKRINNRFLNKVYLFAFGLYEKLIYKLSDEITVQNSFDKDTVLKRSNKRKVTLIPNNMNVEWLSDKELYSANKSEYLNSICFIGSLIERKGILELLKAYVKLVEKGYDLELHILGEGPLKNEIINTKKRFKLDKVHLVGYVDQPLNYLKEMDLLVVPSYIDSFPNVIFEAWYVGVPVIGSKVGGLVDQLKYDTLLFEPKDDKPIINKVIENCNPQKYSYLRKLNEGRKNQFIFDWIGEYEKVINNSE